MDNGGDISTNYGYGKLQVINMVVPKNMKYLYEQMKNKNEKIEHYINHLSTLEKTLSEKNKKHEIERKQNYLKIDKIENQIKKTSDKSVVSKFLNELKKNYGKIEKNKTDVVLIESKAKIEKKKAPADFTEKT